MTPWEWDLPWGWLAAAVVLGVVLAARSESRVEMPSQAGGEPPPEGDASRAGLSKGWEPFEGEVHGVAYEVDTFDDETMTILLELDGECRREIEVETRGGPAPKLDPLWEAPVRALLDLGFEEITVGDEAGSAQARLWPDRGVLDRARAEKAVPHLAKLRDIAQTA